MNYENITPELLTAYVGFISGNRVNKVEAKPDNKWRISITNRQVNSGVVWVTLFDDGLAYGAEKNMINVFHSFEDVAKKVKAFNYMVMTLMFKLEITKEEAIAIAGYAHIMDVQGQEGEYYINHPEYPRIDTL